MFGTDEKYYFYMKFTADADDLWQQASTSNKTFRMLFQMGNTQSDWEGVKLDLTTDVSSDTLFDMLPLAVDNDSKITGNAAIESAGTDNSTFEGQM